MADGGELQRLLSVGSRGRGTSGPQLPAPDHPQAGGRLGAGGPTACVPQWPIGISLLPSGVTGLHGKGRCSQEPFGDTSDPSSASPLLGRSPPGEEAVASALCPS